MHTIGQCGAITWLLTSYTRIKDGSGRHKHYAIILCDHADHVAEEELIPSFAPWANRE